MSEINHLIAIFEERIAGIRSGLTAETEGLLALTKLVKSHEARIADLESKLKEKVVTCSSNLCVSCTSG